MTFDDQAEYARGHEEWTRPGSKAAAWALLGASFTLAVAVVIVSLWGRLW